MQVKGLATEWTSAIPRRAGGGDPGRGHPDKPVGAVSTAAKVLRMLHASERPLHASEVARATGLHRGTASNILRTLSAEGFVGYDEATRSDSVSLHILELAHGVLRRSVLLDWVGAAFRTDLSVTVGRQCPGPVGASGVIMGAFGSGAAFRERAIVVSRVMSSMTRWRGRQHGWIVSGSRQHCN